MLFVEIVCNLPPTVDNARPHEVTGYKLADTAEYICDEGYELKGPKYIVCQLDGLWSERPVCVDGELLCLNKIQIIRI